MSRSTLPMRSSVHSGLAEEWSQAPAGKSLVQRAQALFRDGQQRLGVHAKQLQERVAALVQDEQTQAAALGASGGAAAVGAGAAATGVVLGGTIGAALGLLPAVVTFGMSIPVIGAIGATAGGFFGAAAGTAVGAAGGCVAGNVAYQKRDKISSVVDKVRTRVQDSVLAVQGKALQVRGIVCDKIGTTWQRVGDAGVKVSAVAEATRAKTAEVVADGAFQAGAASAVSSAAVMGAGGAATGCAVGGLVGAAVGIVPAVFTFGLSIPVCAMLGSGAGTFAGTLAGGSAGFLGGGAAGFKVYQNKDALSAGVSTARSRVEGLTGSLRSRMVAATGGTD